MNASEHTAAERAPGWRASPALSVTLATHLAGAAALALQPSSWPAITGVLLINHLTLFLAALVPRGRWLGPNLVRLSDAAAARHEICLTFDDGPDPEVTPRVLDLLERYRARASFFCIGAKAAAFPDLVREIARRGHSIENHTFSHSPAFAWYGWSRLRGEVEAAQAIIVRTAGVTPAFFRAPAGFRSPLLAPVLDRCGLRYVSWTRRGYDSVQTDPARVLRRLKRDLAAGDVLLLHDGAHARTAAGVPVVLPVLRELLEELAARGLKSVSLPTACGASSRAANRYPHAAVSY